MAMQPMRPENDGVPGVDAAEMLVYLEDKGTC